MVENKIPGLFKAIFSGGFKEIYAAFKKEVMEETIKGWKKVGKNLSEKKGLKGLFKFAKSVKTIGTMAMGPINAIMSFMDALGIAQPFLDIFSGILELVGAAALEALTPALEVLTDLFSDEEFIDSLSEIGRIIGQILVPVLQLLAPLLKLVAKGAALVLQGLEWGMGAVAGWFKQVREDVQKQKAERKERVMEELIEKIKAGTLTEKDKAFYHLIRGIDKEEIERLIRVWDPDQEDVSVPGGAGRIRGIVETAGATQGGTTYVINVEGNVYGEDAADKIAEDLDLASKLGA